MLNYSNVGICRKLLRRFLDFKPKVHSTISLLQFKLCILFPMTYGAYQCFADVK